MNTEEQKVAELLKPRYKVIADYPGNKFKIGDVITFVREVAQTYDLWVNQNGQQITFNGFGLFPHLFKRLEWWEEREDGFIKSIKYWKVLENAFDVVKKGQILTAHDFKWWGFADDKDNLRYFLPATKKEYESFINQNKQQ